MKNMKNFKLLLAFICLSAFFIACGSKYVAKIDDKKISLEEFNIIFYAYHRSTMPSKSNADIDKMGSNPEETKKNPALNKSNFLNMLVEKKLIYNHAMQDKITQDDELKFIVKQQKKTMAVIFYTKKKFKDKLENVPQADIEKFYNENKKYFQNQPMDKVENYIKAKLQVKIYDKLTREYIETLKEKVKIEKNKELIKKLAEKDVSKQPTSGWLVKIDGQEVTIKDFNQIYYTQHKQLGKYKKEDIDKYSADPSITKQNPLLIKDKFLEFYISQLLLLKDAENANFLNDKDYKALAQIQTQELINNYFFYKKFSEQIKVTPEEIDQFYAKNKARLGHVSDTTKLEGMIKERIKGQKFMSATKKFVTELKEKSTIEKKPELFTKKEK